jgi:choline dehydrogenase
MDEFDYVIVGGGSAGSIVAARLSESPGVTVCLLEAGPEERRLLFRVPAGFFKLIFDPRYTWSFESEPQPFLFYRRVPAIQGRLLGGSGSINGMVYSRGQPGDFDDWAARGNPGWSFREVLPYFKRSERRIGAGDDAYRGREGGLPVTDLRWRNALCDAFIAAAGSAGIPRNPDYNGASQLGAGLYQFTVEQGLRASPARDILQPARRRAGLHVVTGAHASAIVFEGRRAVGVEYLRPDTRARATVRARREVVVCAGALNTPKLLQLSGIGPGLLLNDLGVPVVVDRPGVGANLQDHFSARLVARVRGAETINDLARGWRFTREVGRWMAQRPSILDLGPVQGFAFARSAPELPRPDITLTFTPASSKAGFVGVLDDAPGVTCGAWQLRPESTGLVRARSRDPLEKPAIHPNYLAEDADRVATVAALRLARRVLARPELERHLESELLPGEAVQTDDEWLDFARRYGLSTFHSCGTARMGRANDSLSVVDAELRVHGVERLRVADASVMPRIPSANTNAATMMIAERAADLILGRALPVAADSAAAPAAHTPAL